MSIREQVEKVLKKNNIKFFKGNGKTKNVFNIPYRGISNESNHINIYVEIVEELDIVKFMLIEKSNPKIEINQLKGNLLDINSSLNFGTLSMRNDSDTVEYKIDYQISESGFLFEQYQRFVVRCIKIYESLKEDDLIL